MNTPDGISPLTEVVLECLSCTLNRGTWFTARGLVNATGIEEPDVITALQEIHKAGLLEARPPRPYGTWEYRVVW